ncbi:hypothetical protein PCYB_092840 [Plasmodium cynomolgi strain B]|uniref:Uncharacterized protein n=1 Tax=Plasmodium cynomolgi (strain B) TaxID=1120755 RepID=K6UTB3_PLACD|nr:hypothetical protein PCYB_092840 [Plasmodium cynomolgi strain B]GAB66499.1 hypothetical protein PCYB_092840 [Plasmodium cynomolgi strain B]
MKYDVITQTRKNAKNFETPPQEDVHEESVTINMNTKDNFDISILPDLTYLKYLQIQIEIFYLHKRDCLVAKTTPVQFLGLNEGRSLLSDIYSNEDHFVLFSEGPYLGYGTSGKLTTTTLKKIQSNSLQQVSYFDIITEEAYLKEEKENKEERSNDNFYACCFIQLYEPYVIKSYISIPFNGKEPYFSVFLTKKKTQKRLKKLQDYLNTTVVNKHSKVEDTQRQIILTLQLAKLREGAHKYYKSFSKSSTPIFDEEIN